MLVGGLVHKYCIRQNNKITLLVYILVLQSTEIESLNAHIYRLFTVITCVQRSVGGGAII